MLAIEERQAFLDARTIAPAAERAAAETGRISLSIVNDLAQVEDIWRSFESRADCTVFQTYDWHAAWQRHIGDREDVTPAIVVGRTRGRVLFLLPLAVERCRGVRRLVWHASDLCDYNAPLLAPDFTRIAGDDFVSLLTAATRLIAARMRFDAVVLTKMPELVGAQRNPFLDLETTLNPSGAYLMAIHGPWEAFYKEKRSSATRRHDRSKRKRLAEFGPVEFVNATEPCVIEKTLDALFAQKAASFATRGVANFLARPGTREFYRALGADASFRDILHIAKLQVGPTIAAANLGLVFRGRYYHVLASYDAGPVSRFGPGIAHLHDLVAHALGRGCTIFDFTVGDEPYKREWCDTELRLHDFHSAATLRGWMSVKASVGAARVKRFVKQTPRLSMAVHRLRIRLAALKRGRVRRPFAIGAASKAEENAGAS
jgi:CelD/BcsL family acetyltransferase involved in cellulose biosynthesis